MVSYEVYTAMNELKNKFLVYLFEYFMSLNEIYERTLVLSCEKMHLRFFSLENRYFYLIFFFIYYLLMTKDVPNSF